MNMRCVNPVDCPAAGGEPVLNLSAEEPDQIKFFGYRFFQDSGALCVEDTEALAEICFPPFPTNPPSPILYTNQDVSCEVPCSGGSETYTVVTGSFLALSSAEANSLAYAFACTLAQMLCTGTPFQIFTNTDQICVVDCPDGTQSTITIPAGTYSGLSQAEADSGAYGLACTVASLLCNQIPQPEGIPPSGGAGTPPTRVYFGNSAQRCARACANGSSFTYLVPAGSFVAESYAAANAIAESYACYQARVPICLTDILPDLCVGSSYADVIEVTGTTSSIRWSNSGGLPPGVAFNDGVFAGTPLIAGNYSVTVRATLDDGSYTERVYEFTVREISPPTLPDASVGTLYSEVLIINDMASPTWSVTSGSLPPGLSLHPFTGLLSGTPTLGGNYNFVITASE